MPKPFPGVDQVGGVSYDGRNVWIAAGGTLKAVDPSIKIGAVVVTGPEHESAGTASSEPIVAAEAFGSASAGHSADQQAAGSAGGGNERPA